VLVQMQGPNDRNVSLELSRHQAVDLALSLCRAVEELPYDPEVPLHSMSATDPSFQVGITPSGNVFLAIKPGSFPWFEFEFTAEILTMLVSGLRKAANVPNQPRGKPS
jgi:hypothetical protein